MHANIPLFALCAGVAFAGPIWPRQAPAQPGRANPQGVPANPNSFNPGAQPAPLTPGATPGGSAQSKSSPKKINQVNSRRYPPNLPAGIPTGNAPLRPGVPYDSSVTFGDPNSQQGQVYPFGGASNPATQGKLPNNNARPNSGVLYDPGMLLGSPSGQRGQPVSGSWPSKPAAREYNYEKTQGRTGYTNEVNSPGTSSTRKNQPPSLQDIMFQRGLTHPNTGRDRLDPATLRNDPLSINEANANPVGRLGSNQGQEIAMDIMPPIPVGRCPSQTKCIARIVSNYARTDCLASERYKPGCSMEIQSAFNACLGVFCSGDSETVLLSNANRYKPSSTYSYNNPTRDIPAGNIPKDTKPNRDTATGGKRAGSGFSGGAGSGTGSSTGPGSFTGPEAATAPGSFTGPGSFTSGIKKPAGSEATAQENSTDDATGDIGNSPFPGTPQNSWIDDSDSINPAVQGTPGSVPEDQN